MKVKYLIPTVLLAFLTAIPIVKAVKTSQNKDQVILRKDNVIHLNDEVSNQTVSEWLQKARALDAKGPVNEPIYLYMESPGGDILAGIDFIEGMKGIHRPIVTITSFAASMAFQIVQNMGERLILKNGILMSHRAAGGFEGTFGGTEPSQLTSRYLFFLSRIKELDQQTVSRTNGKQTLESYQKAYANEMWKAGNDAVAEGYADRVVSVSCDSSLNGTSHHTAETMFGHAEYDLSDCPMIKAPLNVTITISTNQGPVTDDEFIKKNGRFDAYCMSDIAPNKLCALDTSLNPQKIEKIKEEFKASYLIKQNKVVN